MNNQELDKLLERLHAELERADNVDEKGQELLRHIDTDIRALLGRPESEMARPASALIRLLQESIAYLEVSHPKLTSLLSDMLTSLSNAGI